MVRDLMVACIERRFGISNEALHATGLTEPRHENSLWCWKGVLSRPEVRVVV
jgi:hypothetical protein